MSQNNNSYFVNQNVNAVSEDPMYDKYMDDALLAGARKVRKPAPKKEQGRINPMYAVLMLIVVLSMLLSACDGGGDNDLVGVGQDVGSAMHDAGATFEEINGTLNDIIEDSGITNDPIFEKVDDLGDALTELPTLNGALDSAVDAAVELGQ